MYYFPKAAVIGMHLTCFINLKMHSIAVLLFTFRGVYSGEKEELSDKITETANPNPYINGFPMARQLAPSTSATSSTISNTSTVASTGNTSITPLPDNENGATLQAMAWGRYQVAHTYYTTIPYMGHQILIYQQQPGASQENFTDGLQRFFYQPALILDVDGVGTVFNPFIQKHETVIPVTLWNEEYEAYIRKKLRDKLGAQTYLLSMIPVEGIRIKATGANKGLAIMNRWTSYASQPSVHNFRVTCPSSQACVELVMRVQDNPHQFIDDLRVYYSLEGQNSAGKRITVKAEHVQQSSMFSELKQRLPNKDPVYLTADDANRLQNEIANNILATEVQDEEFISDESSPTLMALITKALDLSSQSTAGFDKEMWSSTFWKDENARPDKVTERVNEAYSKMDEKTQETFKNEMSKAEAEKHAAEASGSGFGATVQGGASHGTSSSSSSLNQGEKMKRLAKEAAQNSEFKGEMFKPKAANLKRVNTGNVRSGASLSTSQLRIARATSQITDQIKVMREPGVRTFSGNREVFHVLGSGSNPFFFKRDAKALCMQLGGQLSTMRQLEDAWINGAEWCSSGHLDGGYTGYPGAVCYSKKTDETTGATVLPFVYVPVNCTQPFATKNSFIYKAGDGSEELVENWQFGANCWGSKPLKNFTYTYKNKPVEILNFSPLQYSQYYK